MPKRSSTLPPSDPILAAKWVVDRLTGTPPDDPTYPEPAKNPAAVALGRLGGLKGGRARAAKLTSKERSAIAKKAALARWDRS